MTENPKSIRRTHDPAFKERSVQMAQESGNIAATARQLGIGYSLLNNWRNAADLARSKGQGLAMALEDKSRMAALEKEVANLREENEILKKPQRTSRGIESLPEVRLDPEHDEPPQDDSGVLCLECQPFGTVRLEQARQVS